MEEKRKTALITGAYGGLGSQFVKIHAQTGGDLILVDLNPDRLNDQKKEIEEKYHVTVNVIPADLSKAEEVQKVYDTCKEKGWEVDYLISNAGFGGQGLFWRRSLEKDEAMLGVNIEAPTRLFKLFLPDFVARKSGRILNVSSTSAKMPGPMQAVYFASKAYLTSLGNALWRELQGTGVTLTTLMPGVLETDFAEKGHLEDTKLFSKGVSPFPVAKVGYNAMLKGVMNVTTGVLGLQKVLIPIVPILPKRMVMEMVYRWQMKRSAETGEKSQFIIHNL